MAMLEERRVERVNGTGPRGTEMHRLKANSIGLGGVLFMVIASAAPITAMTGNVPASLGFGNGIGVPASYVVVTAILTLFSVGFVAMARHITAAGAFYGFISNGLGRVVGLGSGFLALLGYVAFDATLIGIFAAFARTVFQDQLHVSIAWPVYAAIALVVVAALSYFDISLAAKVLGFLLVCEISVLALMGIAVLVQGGGPDGFPTEAVNPVNAFRGPAAGVGLVFAFFSWVGFESTAIYGEESRNPKKIVPRATFIAVIGIGLFYIFVSWMAISGLGVKGALEAAKNDPFQVFFGTTETFVGSWAVHAFQWLLMTGSFAAALAFHNCAARYMYAFGREGLLPRALGRTHGVHGSPHIASFVGTVVVALITAGFAIDHQDPYASQYALMGILGTLAIVAAQTLCSFAVIAYFARVRPDQMHWWRTVVAPLVAGIAMAIVVALLLGNLDTAAGAAASTVLFKLIPWIVLATFIAGIAFALYLRANNPRRYAAIGRIVFDEQGLTEVDLGPSTSSGIRPGEVLAAELAD